MVFITLVFVFHSWRRKMFLQPRHWEQPLQRLVLEQCINSVAFLRNQRQIRNISKSSPISFLFQVDNTLPGFAYDYVKGVLKKAEIHDKFDLCETLLRLGGSQDCEGEACNLYVNTYCLYVCFLACWKFSKNESIVWTL